MKGTILKVSMTLLVFVLFFSMSCNKNESDSDNITNNNISIDPNSCEGCHTDYAKLQETYSPDTGAVSGGCGGDVPHFEPYDRVFIGGEGYQAFKESSHYELKCVGCHYGNGETGDKDEAHSGDFISHPSSHYKEMCEDCHYSVTTDFMTSLHHGTGQKRKVTIRSGLIGFQDFDQLPESHKEGYNNNCAQCHGTCGNCHVVRPASGGGGLINGHNFNKTPDMHNVCITCHVSRGGHAYLGVAAGTVPDVHLTKMGYTCLDCHNGNEIHGDGKPVDQRYAYSKLPTCDDCHSGIAKANNYHSMHYDDFSCQTCHSQDYNNCGSCHVHGEGVRIPAYVDYKIASNPIPELRAYDFAIVRRAPSAPDTWKEYDVPEYQTFDQFPTYNYTSPHNLIRWTSRTEVEDGKSCSSSCHIRNENGQLINEGLYLFEKDLLDFEKTASKDITVDGKLPASWTE